MESYIKKQYKKTGFTLAEVLITLLIIGVVSSIVIPALISDTQDAELHTAWKKTYSDLDQATKRILLDNGGNFKNICGSSDNNCLGNEYLKHLNYSKSCLSDKVYGNCWHNNGNVKFLNGKYNYQENLSTGSGAILSSGAMYFIAQRSSTCTDLRNTLNTCGWISVDVNGFKGPNTTGKDIFGIWILENRILPQGTQGDSYNPSANCNNTNLDKNTGNGCSAKYLYQ